MDWFVSARARRRTECGIDHKSVVAGRSGLMKMIRNLAACLAASLLSVPLLYAQDLSKYRQFSLGTSLAEISRQTDQRPQDAVMIQQSPAAIQQLEWWPVPLNVLTKPESVQKVIFSFYNRTLYKIVATYDNDATTGLTPTDMIAGISASYGPVTKPVAETGSHSDAAYAVVEPLARWEDSQYSFTLSRESFLNDFRLVMVAKQLDAQAEASVIEAAKQERSDAPQEEIARTKKAADELEAERQSNLKAFRP
jgi:hypothetical protein